MSSPGPNPTPPRRKVSLDGLTPTDFIAEGERWPRGRLVSPWRDSLEEHGLTPQRARRDEEAVRRLAEVARRLLDFMDARGRNQAYVARTLGISGSTLSDFLTGKRFPSWLLVARVQLFLDEEKRRSSGSR